MDYKKSVILIQEYFEPISKERVLEIRNVLDLNLKNDNIDYIFLLNEKKYEYIENLINTEYKLKLKQIITNKRLTYKDVFDFANINASESSTIILANNDISFCLTSFDNINYVLQDNSNTVIALSRNEMIEGTKEYTTFTNANSQDVWIYSGFMKKYDKDADVYKEADFYFGISGCDNRIAYILSERGYRLRNLPFDIVTLHHHKSNFRTITNNSIIRGLYKTVDIEKIKSIKHIGSEVIVIYNRHDY